MQTFSYIIYKNLIKNDNQFLNCEFIDCTFENCKFSE